MKNVKVSWILPIYNGERYLEKTIISIINQSFTNWELIAIDDGSTDNSLKILNSFSDKRIRVISRENKGLSKTLNEGIYLSNGEYIARIDADDINEEHRLDEQVYFLDTHQEYILVASNVTYIDSEDNTTHYSTLPSDHYVIKEKLKKDNCIFHPSVLIRKQALINIGGYDSKINCYWEDYHLWLNLIEKGKFHILPKLLLKYRVHKKSITQNTPSWVSNDINNFKTNNNKIDCEGHLALLIKKTFTYTRKNKGICLAILKIRDVLKI